MDDSAYNLFVLQELLRNIDPDIHIDTALNGQLALDKVLLEKEPYKYIVLDLHMPVLDGFQVRNNIGNEWKTARRLREMHQAGEINMGGCKIIALSAMT